VVALAAVLVIACHAVAFAADPTEPAPFVADIQAKPIAADTSPAAVLRWTAKSRDTNTTYDAATAAAQPIDQPSAPPRGSWKITRIDPNVRPAQAIESSPFSDPFGDRQAGGQEPMLLLQPTQAESTVETLPAPRASALRQTSPPQLTAAQPGTRMPGPEIPTPAPATLAPTPPRPGVPCDRIYNDRDCCDAETNCTDFRNRLLSDTIRNISLDITPRYNPSLTLEEDVAERTQRLGLLELRQWKDRRGQVRANGKMTNIENGAVIIADENGREIARLRMEELGDDELCYVNAWWQLPIECSLGGIRTAQRDWVDSTFVWHASALCHKPLYFEQVQLERYGHTTGPFSQPFVSGAHFFVTLATLPYKMAINPPHECQYSLGYYRPGSCAPWMIPPIPLSLRGAAAETAAILGGIHLIP
jgi:hypothetical protein